MKLLSALALLFIGPIVLAAEFGPILSRGLNIDLLKKSVRFL